jgi:hypothetical protein
MDHDYSFDALRRFLQFVGEKGLVSGSVAQGWRVATGKILQDLSEAETADVRKINIDLALRKFVNRNPGKLSPNSLSEYKRRAATAIEEFLAWTKDPSGYHPKTGISSRPPGTAKRATSPDREKKKPTGSSTGLSAPMSGSPESQPPSHMGGLPLPYPLRPDFLAQVVIPRDMTTEEAKRLGAFLLTLAVDFKGA